jgi:outer membrane biosynthesis protein TonB
LDRIQNRPPSGLEAAAHNYARSRVSSDRLAITTNSTSHSRPVRSTNAFSLSCPLLHSFIIHHDMRLCQPTPRQHTIHTHIKQQQQQQQHKLQIANPIITTPSRYPTLIPNAQRNKGKKKNADAEEQKKTTTNERKEKKKNPTYPKPAPRQDKTRQKKTRHHLKSTKVNKKKEKKKKKRMGYCDNISQLRIPLRL